MILFAVSLIIKVASFLKHKEKNDLLVKGLNFLFFFIFGNILHGPFDIFIQNLSELRNR